MPATSAGMTVTEQTHGPPQDRRRGRQHLRNSLAYLDVPVMGQPEVFIQFMEGLCDADGNITNDGTRKFLQGYVDKYAAWVAKLG